MSNSKQGESYLLFVEVLERSDRYLDRRLRESYLLFVEVLEHSVRSCCLNISESYPMFVGVPTGMAFSATTIRSPKMQASFSAR